MKRGSILPALLSLPVPHPVSLKTQRPQDTYHAAFQRLDSMNSSLAEEAPATEPGEALHERRRKSLRMMAAMSLNQFCKDAVQDILLPSSDPLDNEGKTRGEQRGRALVPGNDVGVEAQFSFFPRNFTLGTTPPRDSHKPYTVDPLGKFRDVLIQAKESGLAWEGIFSTFTPAPEGTATISQKDFAAGLRKLSLDTSTLTPVRLRLVLWIPVCALKGCVRKCLGLIDNPRA